MVKQNKGPFSQNASLHLKTRDVSLRNGFKKAQQQMPHLPCCHHIKQLSCQLAFVHESSQCLPRLRALLIGPLFWN